MPATPCQKENELENNRLEAMRQLVVNLRAEGQQSRADCVEELIAAVPAQQQCPDGWRMVPIEPTHAMLDEAGRRLAEQMSARTALEYQADAHIAWDGMLAAIPAAPAPSDIPKSADGNFDTGDQALDLLLGLTEDMTLGKCNMDSGLLWHDTMGAIVTRLQAPPAPSASQDAIDALRYRWLRDQANSAKFTAPLCWHTGADGIANSSATGSDLDEAMDYSMGIAARANQEKSNG
jgi:hypothetical protein